MQQRVRVLFSVAHKNLVNVGLEVVRLFNLGTVSAFVTPVCVTDSTYRLAELENRLAGNVRLLGIILDLDIDDMDGAVELSSSCEEI
jgi:hypothetical protein